MSNKWAAYGGLGVEAHNVLIADQGLHAERWASIEPVREGPGRGPITITRGHMKLIANWTVLG